jgi:hypothetical protein
MESTLEVTARDMWLAIVARQQPTAAPEKRRKHGRRHAVIGNTEAVFTCEGRTFARPGKLVDLSPAGVQIQQSRPIGCGALALVRVVVGEEEAILAGRVIHCTKSGTGFKVGIQWQFETDGEDA